MLMLHMLADEGVRYPFFILSAVLYCTVGCLLLQEVSAKLISGMCDQSLCASHGIPVRTETLL